MRTNNQLKAAIESGGTAVGAIATIISPTVVEVYGDIGLNFVFLDFEHIGPSAWDSTNLEELTRAADAGDIELVVRVPSGAASAHPPLLRKVLDAGVRTVLVPRVETTAEVREAVKATKFTYDGEPGERGIGGGRSNMWGAELDEAYPAREDDETLLGVMIENETAVANLDEIVSVPDLGFVFVGPNDLSVSKGTPMRKGEAFQETVETIHDACREANVPIGHWFFNVPDLRSAVDRERGQMICLGSELGAARQLLGPQIEEIREASRE